MPTFNHRHTHSYTDGKGCHARYQPAHQEKFLKLIHTHSHSLQEQFVVQYLAQGQLWTGRAGDWTTNLPIRSYYAEDCVTQNASCICKNHFSNVKQAQLWVMYPMLQRVPWIFSISTQPGNKLHWDYSGIGSGTYCRFPDIIRHNQALTYPATLFRFFSTVETKM